MQFDYKTICKLNSLIYLNNLFLNRIENNWDRTSGFFFKRETLNQPSSIFNLIFFTYLYFIYYYFILNKLKYYYFILFIFYFIYFLLLLSIFTFYIIIWFDFFYKKIFSFKYFVFFTVFKNFYFKKCHSIFFYCRIY